ncbi:tail protein [Xanthomonas phage RTH11]|nr:tail protein [Xanthomonas phage RTH11]
MYNITLISLDLTARAVVETCLEDIFFGDVMRKTDTQVNYSQEGLVEHLASGRRYDAIITPGNGHGHMTGGFDGALIDVFGQELDERVRADIESNWLGELPVGNARMYHLGRDEASWMVYSPTMRVPKILEANSEAPYISTLAAFQRINRYNLNKPKLSPHITDILLPMMAGGTARLDPRTVVRQMQLALMRAVAPQPVRDIFDDGQVVDKQITGRRYNGNYR